MAKPTPLPPRGWLIDNLEYNPETGIFFWKKGGAWCAVLRPAGVKLYRKPSGEPTGIAIQINGKKYKAHRLAWLMVTGDDPGLLSVDHINRMPFDNRFCNLRLADQSLQLRNSRPRGISPYKGVAYHKANNRWTASRHEAGKKIYLGSFKTQEEAAVVAAPYYLH